MARARIFIVEDEVIIARDIEQTLISLGYEVSGLAYSAEDALDQLLLVRCDLVLMDIQLSGGMDGVTATKHIHSRKHLPVIYLTAHSDKATLQRAQTSGPFGYILKPFDEHELEVVIDIALYRHMMETKLSQMEHWLATILKSIGDAVIATDIHGNITFMNAVAELLTGWSEQETLGQPISTVLRLIYEHTGEAHESLVTRVLTEQAIIELSSNTLLVTRDSTIVPIDDSAAPIRDDTGQITGVVIVFRDISSRKQIEEHLRFIAMHDALTGLPNRALLMDRLHQAIERIRRDPHHQIAVMYLDLDRFKTINDSLGHHAGDQLLIATARQLEAVVRAEDTVARLGGDEFVVVLSSVTEARDAILAAERILHHMAQPLEIAGQEIYTAMSIGIVLSDSQHQQPEALLRDADTALYRAKALGKGRYVLFNTELHEHAIGLLHLENDLRRAVARQEFRIYYQPIVALATNQICGFEALLRWQHPERGLLAPSAFLELAEETGTLLAISEWLIREACQQLCIWQAQAPTHASLSISVNISNSQFWQAGLVDQVSRVLLETGLNPAQLCLELTENVIGDHEQATHVLSQLDNLGIGLHVDDFGTGYSSLSVLHQVPINTLKIDRTFIQRLNQDHPEKSAIVRTIILLANALTLAVVAEGIETGAEVEVLTALGCQYGQGYWFSKPIAAAAVTKLLQ